MSDAETLQPLLGIATVIIAFGGIPMTVAGIFISVVFIHDHRRPSEYLSSRPLGNAAAFLGGVAAGVATWIIWLTWGGPAYYAPWQIIGAVVTGVGVIIVLGLMARWRRSGPLTVGLGGLLGFSTTFAVEVGFYDDTGLWGVGYMMLIAGAGCGLFLISLCVALIRTPQQRPRPHTPLHPQQ